MHIIMLHPFPNVAILHVMDYCPPIVPPAYHCPLTATRRSAARVQPPAYRRPPFPCCCSLAALCSLATHPLAACHSLAAHRLQPTRRLPPARPPPATCSSCIPHLAACRFQPSSAHCPCRACTRHVAGPHYWSARPVLVALRIGITLTVRRVRICHSSGLRSPSVGPALAAPRIGICARHLAGTRFLLCMSSHHMPHVRPALSTRREQCSPRVWFLLSGTRLLLPLSRVRLAQRSCHHVLTQSCR